MSKQCQQAEIEKMYSSINMYDMKFYVLFCINVSTLMLQLCFPDKTQGKKITVSASHVNTGVLDTYSVWFIVNLLMVMSGSAASQMLINNRWLLHNSMTAKQ